MNKTISVLLADDDPHTLFFLRHTFEGLHVPAEITHFKNGEQLINFLEHHEEIPSPKTACILLDLNMPRKDGRETLAEIRSRNLGQGYPVALLSHQDLSHEESGRLGADLFFEKPIGLDEYKTLARKIISMANSGPAPAAKMLAARKSGAV